MVGAAGTGPGEQSARPAAGPIASPPHLDGAVAEQRAGAGGEVHDAAGAGAQVDARESVSHVSGLRADVVRASDTELPRTVLAEADDRVVVSQHARELVPADGLRGTRRQAWRGGGGRGDGGRGAVFGSVVVGSYTAGRRIASGFSSTGLSSFPRNKTDDEASCGCE